VPWGRLERRAGQRALRGPGHRSVSAGVGALSVCRGAGFSANGLERLGTGVVDGYASESKPGHTLLQELAG